ncbi:hypothetical protein FSU_0663 [Fibrobacter succinogenes subsp. succinogenes S85]|uniref:Type IV pilus assembly PilZ n=1 Tax=Fibrobacter succinogenes (strain ATCC 19169 / S85) TaxID=59374 RepID=C9RKD7_FIBSS|nr:PilZ domain-containing protein [Fibrobacter succinogenes]ACX73865.1 type IV pilus assembly PilZ [Fibrobacter succinogenes subsp. succinogenes S85]ADL26483.1 hypothetical protein FSU_0663 [Fibrobacter succinogenes subsp. succinogenes S85]
MISWFQEVGRDILDVWMFFTDHPSLQILVIVLIFLAVVLIEVQLMYKRRETDVMFGTDAFNEKIKAFDFTPKEVETLGDLVRSSKFENMDAVLNSSGLFEAAVSEYYRIRNVFSVRDETLEAIAGLRRKMDFTGSNPLSMVCSTRQFNIGDKVDLEFENGQSFKRIPIYERTEKVWSVKIDGSPSLAKALVGSHALVRWTRMNDAVYSIHLNVLAATPDKVVFTHSASLDKEQLRKWVRQVVDFPVTATFPNGDTHSGVLYDLSAGGILLGLADDVKPDQQFSISFELPTFGVQNVDVKVLNNLGHRNPNFPLYNSISAVFTGAYAWTQERVLQYIFESTRKAKSKKTELNGVNSETT